MRTFTILTLLIAFVAAVILPHGEVGTHELPAVGANVVAKTQSTTVEPPAKGGPVACFVPFEAFADATFAVCESAAWRSMRSAGNVQLNLPLLI